jgi:hypothetical protein
MSASGDERIKQFAALGNQALLDLMPLHAPLQEIEAEPNHKRALMLLSTECLGRSQTVFYLVLGLRLWDAEILGRALFEGTVKFVYILESSSNMKERLIEFSEVLPAISKLRWHGKAEEALAALGDDGSLGKQPYRDMILSPEELAEIRQKYPREERRRVEGRWGFTELVTSISRPGGAFGPVGRSSLHRYMVSSHLTHMTYEGVDMPLERDHRSSGFDVGAPVDHHADGFDRQQHRKRLPRCICQSISGLTPAWVPAASRPWETA